ncbi:hypothetical protein SB18R_03175 [Pseudomonas oryzihabitans]|nr:hypothetical protein SB9_12410 [Pseudomonas psychrotolerans]KTT78249.1 hypothetical protein SB18R_03175 [Pseudomonas psychrotolerans]
MREFQRNDLAILLVDVGPVLAGSIVTLVRLIPAGEEILCADRVERVIASPVWEFAHHDVPEGYSAAAPERRLMPLGGDFAPDRQKAKELDHA